MEFKAIVEDAIEKSIASAVDSIIAEKSGYGNNTDIHQLLKETARKMLDTDEELRSMIIDALKSWISIQTADDYRMARAKRQEELQKRNF